MSQIVHELNTIETHKRWQYLSYEWHNWSTNWCQFSGIPFALKFEHNFRHSHPHRLVWLREHWHYSLFISIVYILVIHVLKNLMNSRKPFSLRHVLIVWNTGLALFSITAAIRCLPEFMDNLLTKGFTQSFCNSSYYEVCIHLYELYFSFNTNKLFYHSYCH